MSEVLKWLEEESDRLTEESLSNADPHKTVNNSFLEGFNYALANVQGLDQPQLNENQQIVLEWLKADYIDDDESNPINSIWLLHDYYTSVESLGVVTAYTKLTDREEAQVLQAFASWLEQEEE